jgi:dephospho-CoA kinase
VSPASHSALSIGLTGGIGSGKSTVAALLVNCGAVLVDTDAIARSLTAVHGGALPAIAREFGAAIIGADRALDRDRMREMAFADASAKARLEAILHPLIGTEAQRQARMAGTKPVVFDVPLLAESSHWRLRVRRVLVVDCRDSTQVRRVVQRSGWAEDQVRRVIAQQATRSARRAIADAVIFNDELALQALQAQVASLWQIWSTQA